MRPIQSLDSNHMWKKKCSAKCKATSWVQGYTWQKYKEKEAGFFQSFYSSNKPNVLAAQVMRVTAGAKAEQRPPRACRPELSKDLLSKQCSGRSGRNKGGILSKVFNLPTCWGLWETPRDEKTWFFFSRIKLPRRKRDGEHPISKRRFKRHNNQLLGIMI